MRGFILKCKFEDGDIEDISEIYNLCNLFGWICG